MENVCNKKDSRLIHEWTNLKHIFRVGNYKWNITKFMDLEKDNHRKIVDYMFISK
jgi:hypothetical protein